MSRAVTALLLTALAQPAACVVFSAAPKAAVLAGGHTARLRGGRHTPMVMHMFREDCTFTSGAPPKANGTVLVGVNGDNEPGGEVLKDGFYEVDCVKDYMFEHGDPVGDNKYRYKKDSVSGAAIVRYSSHVKKEDREEMTHEVCFRFCRTVKNMVFFGLTNGRECYCTSFYQAEADDSSQCDLPCDGDTTTMCGGKTKSTIFGMHMCSNYQDHVTSASNMNTEAEKELKTLHTFATDTGKLGGMQAEAKLRQTEWGKLADPGVADLFQAAKVWAGKVAEVAGRADKAMKAGVELRKEAKDLKAFKTPEDMAKAEESTRKMDENTAAMQSLTLEMEGMLGANQRVSEAKGETRKVYYNAAKLLGGEATDAQYTTCFGPTTEQPMMAGVEGCAQACDNDLHECTGYFFQASQADAKVGTCFLLSEAKKVTYYKKDGCKPAPAGSGCFLKFSKYEGEKLKNGVRADRCVA